MIDKAGWTLSSSSGSDSGSGGGRDSSHTVGSVAAGNHLSPIWRQCYKRPYHFREVFLNLVCLEAFVSGVICVRFSYVFTLKTSPAA